MVTKVFQILKQLLKANYILLPPKKLKTIIWGKPKYFEFLKEKKYKLDFNKINVIHVWGEQYNLFILLKCILKLKFSFLEYTYEYINYTGAKTIITFLDNYKNSYKLKTNSNQKLIIIQNAWRSGEDAIFKGKKKDKKKVDYVLIQNKNLIKEYRKVCTSNIHPIGSFESNHVSINNKIKKYDVLYVSTYRNLDNDRIHRKVIIENYLHTEKKMLQFVNKYCLEKNRKLHILPTRKEKFIDEEVNFIKTTVGQNCNIIDRDMLDNTFQFKTVDCSNIVIGIDSTLLYESFGRGSRTVFCDLRPKDKFLKKNRYFGWPKKFSTQGPFWTSKSDYISLRNLINRVTNYKNNQWRYFMKKFQKDLMPYDKNNVLFYNILNK